MAPVLISAFDYLEFVRDLGRLAEQYFSAESLAACENGDPRRIGYTCMTFVVHWRYSMLAIRLPESIEARLNALAQETGRAKSTLAREAILEYIDDLEDYYLAEARARMNRNTIPLADVERELGL